MGMLSVTRSRYRSVIETIRLSRAVVDITYIVHLHMLASSGVDLFSAQDC